MGPPALCRKAATFNLKRRIRRRFFILQCCIRCYIDRMGMCSIGGRPIQYNMLPHSSSLHSRSVSCPAPPPAAGTPAIKGAPAPKARPSSGRRLHPSAGSAENLDSNLVALKISLLGDSHIGKTSFLTKYVGNEQETDDEEEISSKAENGLRTMDKTLDVKGARISYSMWEVDGGEKSQLRAVCKDSVAILFMFDLTSRCTLNSVISWYNQARKLNQKAIPIMIGTKFDDFIQLPLDLQSTIASQARGYAKLMNAPLFFSSATYNINVNKIFKFITAKLFDSPWSVERNLTVGEPIIDF